MLARFLVAALCLAVTPVSASFLNRGIGGAGGGAPAYTDFCSQSFIAGSCTYVYDLGQRRVSTNTVPFQLTRLDNSATINASYTGSTFSVNVAALISACGGTTTALTYSTQYNNCVYTTVYDQTGSGCDLVSGGPSALGTTHAPFFQVRLSDGAPAIIQSSQNPATSPAAKWLYKNGCTTLDGSVARTQVSIGNNAYFSNCCGQYGKIETAPAPGNVPAGSMWSVSYYHSGGNIDFGADIEGGGACTSATPITLTPVIDDISMTTYSTTAGGSNTYYNNTLLGGANCSPHSSIATQDGMVIGCSGDYTACGPIVFRGMAFLSVDASLTAGLPTQIYNYLTAYP